MRLDPEHANRLRKAVSVDENGEAFAKFDIDFMLASFSRLTPWERGILTDALLRSAQSKRPTIEQRSLLALFVARQDDGGGHE